GGVSITILTIHRDAVVMCPDDDDPASGLRPLYVANHVSAGELGVAPVNRTFVREDGETVLVGIGAILFELLLNVVRRRVDAAFGVVSRRTDVPRVTAFQSRYVC